MEPDEVAARLDELHAEIRRLEALHFLAAPPHGWLYRLETDARTQYRIHLWAARFWVLNAVAVVSLFFLTPGIWLRASVLYLILVSLYANLSTDYGAMSAALAIDTGKDHGDVSRKRK